MRGMRLARVAGSQSRDAGSKHRREAMPPLRSQYGNVAAGEKRQIKGDRSWRGGARGSPRGLPAGHASRRPAPRPRAPRALLQALLLTISTAGDLGNGR
jgi:hypothetical protein